MTTIFPLSFWDPLPPGSQRWGDRENTKGRGMSVCEQTILQPCLGHHQKANLCTRRWTSVLVAAPVLPGPWVPPDFYHHCIYSPKGKCPLHLPHYIWHHTDCRLYHQRPQISYWVMIIMSSEKSPLQTLSNMSLAQAGVARRWTCVIHLLKMLSHHFLSPHWAQRIIIVCIFSLPIRLFWRGRESKPGRWKSGRTNWCCLFIFSFLQRHAYTQ